MVNVLVLLGLTVWEFAYVLKRDLKVHLLLIEGKILQTGVLFPYLPLSETEEGETFVLYYTRHRWG